MIKTPSIFLIFYFIPFFSASQFTYSPSYDANFCTPGNPTPDGDNCTTFNANPRFLADMNKDGKVDIIIFSSTGAYISWNCGSTFSAPYRYIDNLFGVFTTFYQNIYPRLVNSFQGLSDGSFLIFGFGGVRVGIPAAGYTLTLQTWDPSNAYQVPGGWSTYQSYPRHGADVNGDGKADVVGFYTDGIYLSTSNGTSFSTMQRVSTQFGSNEGWTSQDTNPRFVADVNGDGKADAILFGTTDVYVGLSTGTGFQAKTSWLSGYYTTSQGWSTQDVYPRAMADVNGDGKADIIGFKGGVWVALANNGYFNAPTLWLSGLSYVSGSSEWTSFEAAPRLLGDVNCDGKADIVAFGTTGVKVYLSGTSTESYCLSKIFMNC